jgi:phosphoenolpyruvate phosphomutase
MFSENRLIRIAGAHDGLSAKIVEKSGFDGVWASGLEISTAHAVPDANILTMTEFLSAAINMNDATSIPVVADCDTGFGNSNNVIQLVKKYEAAGIAAVSIEDKHFPKVNSYIPGRQELAPISEFVGKIMAAKNAQTSKDFMVIARVEALIAGWGMEEALKRAQAYADAGADAILIHSKAKTPDEILEFASKWKKRLPLVIVPTSYPSLTAKDIERAGISMVIYANQGMRAAIAAMEEVLPKIVQDGTTANIENRIAPMKEVFDLQGMPKMKESESLYLRTEKEKVTAIIPAAGDHLDEYSMKDIANDIPMAMLDVNGKPILQRQLEVLNNSKIQDVYAIGGYKKEKINVDGVKVIDNPKYKETGILGSIMSAAQVMNGKVLIAYSDILFDNVVLNRLLESNEDITLLIDSSFSSKTYAKGKKVDMVVTDSPPAKGKRMLSSANHKKVLKISNKIRPEEAHGEFAGLMLLSEKGVQALKDTYKKAEAKYKGKVFHESPSIDKASLNDILQEMIDSGQNVSAIETNSGWLEIHSFEDYKYACSHIK